MHMRFLAVFALASGLCAWTGYARAQGERGYGSRGAGGGLPRDRRGRLDGQRRVVDRRAARGLARGRDETSRNA